MIEPTDDMVALLIDAAKSYGEWKPTPFPDLMHDALADVFAMLEQNYCLETKGHVWHPLARDREPS